MLGLGILCHLIAAINAGVSIGSAWGEEGKYNVFLIENTDKCDSSGGTLSK